MFTYLLSRLVILTGCSLLFQQPECGAFLFRNTFYNLHLATESPPVSVDLPADVPLNKLTMLTYVRREGVFPSGSRSKPAVDPHRVLTGSVHKIFAVRKGQCICFSFTHIKRYVHTNTPCLWCSSGIGPRTCTIHPVFITPV